MILPTDAGDQNLKSIMRTMYYVAMLKRLAAPATNDRSPRYMERALAAIHQARENAEPITLLYAATEGRVGLFLQFADHLENYVSGPIVANYPNCTLTGVETIDEPPPG